MSGALRQGLEVAAFRAAGAAWSLLPERAALASGAALGALVGTAFRVRRADVERHLEWAFPDRPVEWRRGVARACYTHFGREAVATVRAAGWSREELRARTPMEGFEAFEAAVRRGEGVVLLTGHLGNWELGGAAIAARDVPLDVVGKGMSNRRFEADLFALRERLGMRVVEMGDASRVALRSLAAGRVVALLGDQSAHGGGPSIPFFGRPAVTARGPGLFAVRSGAPVFVAFALAKGGPEARYRLRFERLDAARSGDADADVLGLTRAYVAALERAVQSAPEQYFWQHRRWKGAPGEEPVPEATVTIQGPHSQALPRRTPPRP